MSWEKLSHPKMYGPEEYFIVSLVIFIIIVMVKHLIYHTLYYWWYRTGRLYIPMKLNNLITSDILERLCSKRLPKTALVCHSLCGYAALRILRASPECHVYLIEPDHEKCAFTQKVIEVVGKQQQVTVIPGSPVDVIARLKTEYDIETLDFAFLTSTSLQAPYYHKIVKLMEESGLYNKNAADPDTQGTIILADKVIHFGESTFLKLVRYSDNYATEYHQMSLEYSPYDITDGMEKAIYVG